LKIPVWGGGALDRTLSVVLVMAIAAALGMLSHTVATSQVAEQFTEFYVLDSYGMASDYIRTARVGMAVDVIVGIHNHEDRTVGYRLEVRIDGIRDSEVGTLVLADEEKWEETVSLTPDRAGDNQKVEFFLYADQESEPHFEPLRLWVNVNE